MLVRLSAVVSETNATNTRLKLTDGQILVIPTAELMPTVAVGEEMTVVVQPAAEARLDQEALAKTLLNQLLSSEHGTA
jgi:hypothetical protein